MEYKYNFLENSENPRSRQMQRLDPFGNVQGGRALTSLTPVEKLCNTFLLTIIYDQYI